MEDNTTQPNTAQSLSSKQDVTTQETPEELPPIEAVNEQLKIYKSFKKSACADHVAPVFL